MEREAIDDVAAAVSVIIPTFNRRRMLGDAILSVLAQRHTNLEVIVVDDGSNDGTREFVTGLIATDDRVRYVAQRNAGVASARNAGMDAATGQFIALLDSDDAWEPWHLELQLAGLTRFPDAGLIWTDADAVDATGRVVSYRYLTTLLSAYQHFPLNELFSTSTPLSELGVEIPGDSGDRLIYEGDVFSPMVMGNLVLTSSVVMRRERLDVIGRFDSTMITGEDYEFFLRACRAGPVAFADIADVRYRVGTPDRQTREANNLSIANGYLQVLEKTLANDAGRITLSPAMIVEARVHAHRWAGEAELEGGSRRIARAHLTTAFRLRPRSPAILVRLVLTLLPRFVVTGLILVRRRIREWVGRGTRRTTGSAA